MVAVIASQIESTLESLTIEEKVSLLSGKDFWRTREIPEKGVATIKTTDGPSGARGGQFTDGCKAAFFPSGVSMAATFDIDTVKEAGKAMAQEVLARQASVLLAPTTCIHRSPLGGRNFESYSEDPFLAGKLTANFVNGLQSMDVAATVKHFVANEQETTRFSVDEKIDERTLREIYLYPFEVAVKESNPWCFMTSYNLINGEHADANTFTLKKVLREEWGYDGLVMSDWGGTNSVSDSVIATLDLEMPGPTRKRGDLLVREAKTRPEVREAVDASVRRLLNLIARVGKWKDFAPEQPEMAEPKEEYSQLIRQAAGDGIVLLKNAGVLPITGNPKSLLVIGPNADQEIAGGGGSAGLSPYYMTTPLESLKARFKDSKVTFERGCTTFKYAQILSADRGCKDAKGNPGAELTYYSDQSFENVVESRPWPTGMVFPIDSLPTSLLGTKCGAKLATTFTPNVDGTYTFGLASIGKSTLSINGKDVLTVNAEEARSELMFTMASREKTFTTTLKANESYELVAVTSSTDKGNPDGPMSDNEDFSSVPALRLGCTLEEDRDAKIMAAVEQAKSADYVIAILGLNNEYESEGHDMHDLQMRLPGLQDRLVSEVAKVNKNIVVCNQSGVPLAMPWLNEVGAVMQCWYQGMEMGNAIADIISGDVNPSGKLPVTFPKAIEDTPCYGNFGLKRSVEYNEGIYVGYRHYDANNVEPLFPFGHGLSYTSYKYSDLELDTNTLAKDGQIRVSFRITNTGKIDGKESYQLYISPVSPSYEDRAVQELKGFGKVAIKAGATETGSVTLDMRAVCRYDVPAHAWVADKGTYAVHIGASSRDLRLSSTFTVKESFLALSC